MAEDLSLVLDNIGSRLTGPMAAATLFLFLSIVAAAATVYLRSGAPRSIPDFVAFMFPPAILGHPSARTDFLFWITRKLLSLPVALPAGISVGAAVAYATHAALLSVFTPSSLHPAQPGSFTVIMFTITMLLTFDISYYIYHNMQHRLPILWELHKVHHSAEVMVGTTKDRVHPLDELMNKVWDGLITGPMLGLWLFAALDPVDTTILGINVYVLRNIIMMDFVRHTHLRISFGRCMNQVVLCPHYHQLHHSADPAHHDRNFGLMLPIWDRMFGTLAIPRPDEVFVFGLGREESAQYRSLSGLYILPLRNIATRLRHQIVRLALVGQERRAIHRSRGASARGKPDRAAE